MSYYTAHNLHWEGKSPTEEEITAMLAPMMEISEDEACSAINGENTKWYESEQHITALSKRWPETIFTLEELGEDGNHTVTYFENGRSLMKPVPLPQFDRTEFETHATPAAA